jgi:hypothetical protein
MSPGQNIFTPAMGMRIYNQSMPTLLSYVVSRITRSGRNPGLMFRQFAGLQIDPDEVHDDIRQYSKEDTDDRDEDDG